MIHSNPITRAFSFIWTSLRNKDVNKPISQSFCKIAIVSSILSVFLTVILYFLQSSYQIFGTESPIYWWNMLAFWVASSVIIMLFCVFPFSMTGLTLSLCLANFLIDKGPAADKGFNNVVIVLSCLVGYILFRLFHRYCWSKKNEERAQRYKEEFKISFDQIISQSQGSQLKWLVIVSVIVYSFVASILGVINAISPFSEECTKMNPLSLTFMLMTDPSSMGNILTSGSLSSVIAVLCIIVSLLGAFLFTGLLISVFSNFLARRVEDYQKGRLSYDLKGHIVFIGYDETLPFAVKQIVEKEENRQKKFIIQTHTSSEIVREDLRTLFSEHSLMKNIIFCNGRRDSVNDIKRLNVAEAEKIYIFGDRSKENHDELNLTCLKIIKSILPDPIEKSKQMRISMSIDDHTRYMTLKDSWDNDNKLNVHVFNLYSDWANILFNPYHPANKNLNIPSFAPSEKESIDKVNLVINGMTRFGVALAIEASQRLPDPFDDVHPVESTITFICPDAKKELNLFRSRYESIFPYVNTVYTNFFTAEHKEDKSADAILTFEFIEGDLFTPEIRELLIKRCNDDKLKMSLYSCLKKDVDNLNSCINLPDKVRDKANIFVLQKRGVETIIQLRSEIGMMYAFGDPNIVWNEFTAYSAGANTLANTGDDEHVKQNALKWIQKLKLIIEVFYGKRSKNMFQLLCIESYLGNKGVETELKSFISTLDKEEQDDCFILFYLALCYSNNLGVNVNADRAKLLHEKIFHTAEPALLCIIARFCENGYGFSKDFQMALLFYRQAAEQNDAYAQNSLGFFYTRGEGVEQDDKQAFYWYKKAAEQGQPHAQCNLGACYYYGAGVEQDFEQAVYWFRKAAEQEDSIAQNSLGLCYQDGEGVEQDYEQAVYWYKKAAEQENAQAQYNLGICYDFGYGVKYDRYTAFEWSLKAANNGLNSAYSVVANFYMCGIPQLSYGKAYEYLSLSKNDDSSALFLKGLYYKFGYIAATPKNMARAVEYFEAAISANPDSHGAALASCELGLCYLYGNGVEENPDKAFKLFSFAATKDVENSWCYLGHCYENGKGTNVDYKKAMECYEKALSLGDKNAQEYIDDLQKLNEKSS